MGKRGAGAGGRVAGGSPPGLKYGPPAADSCLDQADTELYEKQTVRLGQVGEWSTMMERYQTRLRDYALATSETDRQRVSGELAELSARANELQDAYETQIDSDADRRAFETLLAARQRYLEPAGRVVELVDQGLQEDAMALLGGDAGQAGAAYSESLDVIADSRLEAAGETATANTALYERTRAILFAVLALGVLLAIVTAFFIARWISSRLHLVVERVEMLQGQDIASLGTGARAMARGELDHTIQYGTQPLELDLDDEVGALARAVDAIIGSTAETARSFEQAQGVLKRVVAETDERVTAARQGRLDERSDAQAFEGGYRDLIGGLNGLMDAIATPINEATRVLERMAERDLSVRMEGDYEGGYARIKRSLNGALEGLEEALGEVSAVAGQVA
ncbi:MAG: MCP four helix bundle domain-containing protein, partial [Gemmatimonadota bacterium]